MVINNHLSQFPFLQGWHGPKNTVTGISQHFPSEIRTGGETWSVSSINNHDQVFKILHFEVLFFDAHNEGLLQGKLVSAIFKREGEKS